MEEAHLKLIREEMGFNEHYTEEQMIDSIAEAIKAVYTEPKQRREQAKKMFRAKCKRFKIPFDKT